MTQTATPGTESGTPSNQSFVEIDSSQLQTYSNSAYNYRIKYPAGWTVTDSRPANVSIDPAEGRASLDIFIGRNVLPSTSVDQVIASISSSLEKDYEKFRIIGRRNVTLPGGQSATVLDTLIGNAAGTTFRGKICGTIANGRMYMVLALVLEQNYPSVKTALNMIVESLTI